MTTAQEAIIPKFDDDADDGVRKLAIICSKGNLDMAYPGLILATPRSERASSCTCSSRSGGWT
jgi:hypothetical protein